MAPLPPESTARVYLDYSVAGYEHTLQCRIGTGATIQDGVDALAALIGALSDQLYATDLVGLRASNDGSNVSYPLSNTFATSWGDGAAAGDESAQYYDFVGRSVDGRRVRAAVFGAQIVANANIFRLPTSLGGLWLDAWNALTNAEGAFVTISDQQPVWHTYINTGINAYWRNKIR